MKTLMMIAGAVAIAASPLHAQAKPMHAAGTFDVKLVSQADSENPVARMSIDKVFHGDIEGTSRGTMLASMGSEPGSGAYVAIEKVMGTLHGKHGTFALHHVGVMNHNAQTLTVLVIPDSGTEELKGITGSLKIIIDGNKHSYEFEYTLPR